MGAPIDGEAIRQKIRDRTAGGETTPISDDMPVNMAAKLVVEHIFDEANWLNHQQIGTQHLLLGLREERSFAAEIPGGFGSSAKESAKTLPNGPATP